MHWVKRVAIFLAASAGLAALLAGIEFFGGQPMGIFAGSRPDQLGFENGKFAPPSWKPNCVSSTVDLSDKHHIAPIAFGGDPAAAWKRLADVVKAQPRATIIGEKPGYLYAEFKSAGMGFVDDVEFALDPSANVIHARSASRLGIRDFDVNRKRIEAIRAAFAR